MRFYECTIVFPYSWNQVAQGIWKKYPNPQSSHVLSEDTVNRKVVGHKLYSKRLLTKTNRMPKWGERLVSSRNVSIIEESIVDPVSKEVSTYTRNVGLTKVMSCIEKVTYRPCPSNPEWTIAERKAWVDSRIFGLGFAIQKFGMDRYRKNVSKANEGFIYCLQRLFPLPSSQKDIKEISQDSHTKIEEHRLRLKDAARETAKRAKEIAQEKTRPMFVQCES